MFHLWRPLSLCQQVPRKQQNQGQSSAQGASFAQNRNTNSAPTTARQNQARARVNHVALEDAQEAPDVVLGMFLANDHNAVVLFDFGASHSFICAAYVRKANIPCLC